MNKILIWSITAALAGFLFGFDTVVISGADKQLQNLWHSSDAFHGSVVMAMALWGTVIGAIFGGIPTNKIGRKKTLFWIGILYLVSVIGAAFANDPFVFAAFRFIGGLGVGASTIAAPAYVSEIAPADKRGRLVALYQFNIVLGILIAFISNYFLKDIGENAWRWMIGVQAIPSFIYILTILTIPESPRWLLSKNRDEEAREVLYKIDPSACLNDLMDDSRENGITKHENIFMKKYRFPLILAFLIAFFNQFSGINAFLYYAPRIFEEAGLGQNTALLSSIGIGITNLVFTLVGVALIDKLGRKLLMYIGSVGYIISLGLVSASFYYNWGGLSVPIFLFLFIASHAIGQGAVIWVFISEIFPNHIRASGQAFGSSVHWVLAAIIPSLIPMLFSEIGPEVVFLIFTLMMVLQLLFVIFIMPETKGISLEKLSETLTKKKPNKMKLTKQLPLAVYSAAILSLTGLKPFSAAAQNTFEVSNPAEEKMYRPNFHFTPKKGWMNDPNGMFFANGYYHLFYQYYPDKNVWGPMHWGHAISKDLIKWEEQPIAIYPENDQYIFSGSAVVDVNNTTGFKKGKNDPVIAIYTLHDMTKEKANKIDVEQQDIAFSNDNGFTWQKFKEGNPVVKNPGIRDFRDPKVTWDAVHKQWIMVLAAQDRAHFYKSSNLKNWEFLSEFGKNIGGHGGVWECPDFFQIKVEGTKETKWVLIQNLNPGGPNGGSGVQYFVGDFDGKNFTLDADFAKRVAAEKGIWVDYGKDNYAGVTWNNVPGADGRRLFIGWMSNWEYAQQVPTYKWRSATTIPRELKLVKTGNEYNLISNPVKEINKYIAKTITKKSIQGKSSLTLIEEGKVDLSQAIISLKLNNLKQDNYTFSLSNEAGETLKFGLNNVENYLFVDRSKAGRNDFSEKFAATISKAFLKRNQKEVTFKFILDKTSIEIFYNNGEKVMTEIFFLNQPFTSLSIASKDEIEVSNLVINQLKP